MTAERLKVIARPRQAGKTEEAVAWVLEGRELGERRGILVNSTRRAMELYADYRDAGLELWQVSTHGAAQGHGTAAGVAWFVDDAELILAGVLKGTRIEGLALNTTLPERPKIGDTR